MCVEIYLFAEFIIMRETTLARGQPPIANRYSDKNKNTKMVEIKNHTRVFQHKPTIYV